MSDDKRGDAVADQWREKFDKNRKERELSTERLRIRAEMRSQDLEEDTGVIHREAIERQRKEGSDPPSKATPIHVVLTVVRKFPAWGAVIVSLAAIAAYVYLKTR